MFCERFLFCPFCTYEIQRVQNERHWLIQLQQNSHHLCFVESLQSVPNLDVPSHSQHSSAFTVDLSFWHSRVQQNETCTFSTKHHLNRNNIYNTNTTNAISAKWSHPQGSIRLQRGRCPSRDFHMQITGTVTQTKSHRSPAVSRIETESDETLMSKT